MLNGVSRAKYVRRSVERLQSFMASPSPAASGGGRYAGLWLVLDMDGTVTPTPTKAGGHYLPLSESPCRAPLINWIEHGGNLCVVSTAGRRMWRQVHETLRPSLRKSREVGRLVVCGFSGAALFCTDDDGELHEDHDYRRSAITNGTCPTESELDGLIELGVETIRTFLLAARGDPTLIAALSRKYHGPYEALLGKLKEMGDDAFFQTFLTRERMLKHGEFLVETHDALVDVQIIPGSHPVIGAQVTVLGIPMKRFHEFFPAPVVDALQARNFHVKSQPNSVCIVRDGVDKATVVRWLRAHGDRYSRGNRPFSLRHAIAGGDNPDVVDRPLTIFPDMAFVSVAPEGAAVPTGAHIVDVGGEEVGCAAFLEMLLRTDSADQTRPGFLTEVGEISLDALRNAAAEAKAKLGRSSSSTSGSPSSAL